MTVNKMPAHKMIVGKMTVDKMTVYTVTLDGMPRCQMLNKTTNFLFLLIFSV